MERQRSVCIAAVAPMAAELRAKGHARLRRRLHLLGPIGWVSAAVLTQISLQAAQADDKKKCIYITPPVAIAYIYSTSQNSYCK